MGLPPRLDFIAPAETIVPWSSLSVATDTINQPQPPRRRLRPYLNWLERSRDRWKSHAVQARAEALTLRRQVRRLSASRDRCQQQLLHLRRQLHLARQQPEKNDCRS